VNSLYSTFISVLYAFVLFSEVGEVVGKLNFSEAELSLHQKSGLLDSFHQKSNMSSMSKEPGLNLFNTTLDCEKRVSIVHAYNHVHCSVHVQNNYIVFKIIILIQKHV